MIQVLIVDDEKLEREGIKYLLAMEEGEWNIREASNAASCERKAATRS